MKSTDLREKVRNLPHTPGVYLMKSRFGTVIYVGKAKDLRKRVSTYFQRSTSRRIEQPKIRSMIDLVTDIETVEVRSETEALLLEGRLIKEYRPRYNTEFTDDKKFLLIRVDVKNVIPQFRLARNRAVDGSLYFGPFAHSGPLRKTLHQMRSKFGIVLEDARPKKLESGKFLLYEDARADLYQHENEVTCEDYMERVREACRFLEGKSREWLKELEVEMKTKAIAKDFETAASLRDTLFALRKTLVQTRKFTRSLPHLSTPSEELNRLGEVLGLPDPPLVIECFDISHISGTFTVASMVHFKNGKPVKAQYRRFKIQSFRGNDDFRAMEEVVGRRYERLMNENKPLPDVILIDGGKGQVTSAQRAFLILNLKPPLIIGLAKKDERIIFTDERPPLRLPLHDNALRLLQRARDEAHRFANRYNADLRSKRIRESVLDDIPGLGEQRKKALLAHFSTVPRIKEAGIDDLKKVPGIGAEFARKIHEHLYRFS